MLRQISLPIIFVAALLLVCSSAIFAQNPAQTDYKLRFQTGEWSIKPNSVEFLKSKAIKDKQLKSKFLEKNIRWLFSLKNCLLKHKENKSKQVALS